MRTQQQAEPAPAGGDTEPLVAGDNPAPEPIVEPLPAAPEPAPEPEPVAAEPEPVPDWRDRRIDQLTFRLREEQRKNAALATPEPDVALPPAPAAADLDALVNQRAADIAAQTEFNRRCDETANAGKAEFGDVEFTSRVQGLMGLHDRNDPQESLRYNQFLYALLETGEAPTLIHKLGGDLNEAMRIMGLSPVRMGIELARLAVASPTTEPSGAPRPIRPVGQLGPSRQPITADDKDRADTLTTAEWMRRREEQVAKQPRR